MAARRQYRYPVTSDDGQRPCARGDWCSSQTRDDDGTWHPASGPRAFCLADEAKILADARALPDAYRRLAARIGDPVRSGRAVRVPPGSRVLVNGDYDALLRLMAAILGGWAARVRAVPGLQLVPGRYPHGTSEAVGADCGVLVTHPVPLLALADGWMSRTWTWRAGSPMPAELEAEIADLEIIFIGDGWVSAQTRLGGTAAGLDILDLHRSASRLLGETPAPPEILEGVPCRSCEEMSSLARLEQPPPDPEKPEPPFCACLSASCKAVMTRTEYDAWTAMYVAWTRGSGVLTCRRCDRGDCGNCCWPSCSCKLAGHRAG
jgi:hypothetical protein